MAVFFVILDILLAEERGSVKERGFSDPLRHLYTTLDRMLLDGRAEEVDEILRNVDVEKYALVVIIGFLTVTMRWKGLPSRWDLFSRCVRRAEKELPSREFEELFIGLE